MNQRGIHTTWFILRVTEGIFTQGLNLLLHTYHLGTTGAAGTVYHVKEM